MTTMTTAADGSSENESPSDEPTASASTETDKVVVLSSLDGVVAEETELSPPATLPGPGEEEEEKNEEEDVRTRRAAFATAQTPRHCNKKNRGGGGGGSNDNQDMDYAPEDDDDGDDDGDDDRHPCPNPDQVSPHPIAVAGGDENSSSHGKSTRHPRPSTTSTAATAADHWDNQPQQHQYLHPQRTNSQDGMSHEWSGSRSGSMERTSSSSSMSRSTHYGRPPPSYYHPARSYPSGVSLHDGGYHHHYSQYYEDPYDDDFGADPYSSSFSAHNNGNHQDRHHHLHPHAVALNDPRRYDPQQLRTVVDTTRHPHPDHRHPPVHHRPHAVYRGGASAVREHLPHYRSHPPPPGHPRTPGTMDDPRYSPRGSATNDYDYGHDDSHFASRNHRANHPYAPRGGGICDYAYHRYEAGATLSPPPPLSSSQRHQDRYHFDGGYPPSVSKGEAVPGLLLPGPRGGGGAGHHRAVIVSGERRLLKRSPPQQQRQMGREGGTAPPSRSPSGGEWQHSNRRHPLSSSGGVIDGGTMTTNINADQGGVDDVERGDGSMTSVQGTASSSIGASIHAVSSSFSNEGSRQTKQTLGGVDRKGGGGRGGPLPEHPAATKQSPGVVTSSGSFGASIKTTIGIYQEASLLLPNQPSLKSIEDDYHSPRSDSSWRQLQQIASVDKQEMMRMQSSSKSVSTYASECKKTCSSPVIDAEVSAAAAGKGEKEVVAAPMEKVTADSAVPADHGTVDTADITTTPSVDDDDDGRGGAANKRASPGELQTALSRTSSLSNSPTDDDHHNVALRHSSTGNDDAVVVAVHEDREYAPPPPQSIDQYRMMQHPSHTPPPHPQHHHSPYHPSHYGALPAHPPPHLHPSRLTKVGIFTIARRDGEIGGIGETTAEGEDENSPSASTISTKASLAIAMKHLDRGAREDGVVIHPRDRSFKNYPPAQNMKLKHPVQVKKAREGAFGHNNVGSNYDDMVDVDFSRSDAFQREEAKRRRLSNAYFGDNNNSGEPNPTRKERSPTVALDGRVPLAVDGRIMAESPAATSAGADSSHHSQQSLELGALPSWETAGKLAGWSVCSGTTFSEMESLKDGVFSSAFSFSESVPVKDKNREINFGAEDDPSPKSILSKSGEKRKIAPGTHVQFSRDHDDRGLGSSTSMAPESSMGGGGTELRKRSHGMVTVRPSLSAMPPSHPPPPPHHFQDEYYYGDNLPRHATYPYDQFDAAMGGGRHLPPPHQSHRHPHDHEHYIEEDPYYDQYYGPPPPPPPPYGYPPHSRHHLSKHPHYRPEYVPPPPHHHAMPPQRQPVSGGEQGRNIYTVHTPPTATSRNGGLPASSIHYHPPIYSQFSHIRSKSIAAGVDSRDPSFGSWSNEDDNALMDLMRKVKSPKSWVPIAKKFDRGKSAREIQDRWTRYLKPGSRKGQWTDEEDAVVIETVQNSMEDPFTRWSDLAQRLPGRVGKQVRDRWVNHLNPAINHLPFSREDDILLWEGHRVAGKRWVEISSKYFKGTRSENHIKNRWYSASFKKFIAKEFGPNAYRALNDIGGGVNTETLVEH